MTVRSSNQGAWGHRRIQQHDNAWILRLRAG
jgi:hypothetical protein